MDLDEACSLAMAAMLFFEGWRDRIIFGIAGRHPALLA